MNRSVFAIHRRNDPADMFYSAHGSIGGVEDAIGYGSLPDARKFLSCEDAQTYIDHELPKWGRALHNPMEIHAWELGFSVPGLAAWLMYGEGDIPHRLLEPAPGRLLVWRR